MPRLIQKHAHALRQVGHFRELDEFLRQVREVRPTALNFITLSAFNLARLHQHDEAIELAKEGTRLHPVSPDARNALVSMYLSAERFDLAIATAQEWQQENFSPEKATGALAKAYLCAGRIDSAIKTALAERDLDPNYLTLASAYLYRRDFNAFEAVTADLSGTTHILLRAVALYFQNQSAAAQTLLEDSIETRFVGRADVLRLAMCEDPVAKQRLTDRMQENYGEQQLPFMLDAAEHISRDNNHVFFVIFCDQYDAIDKTASIPVFSGPIRPSDPEDIKSTDPRDNIRTKERLPAFLKAAPPKAQS